MLQAARDKSNFDAGARFTNSYWARGYGYQDSDLQPQTAALPAKAEPQSPAFAQSADVPDPLQPAINTLTQSSAPLWSAMIDQVQTLVNAASTPAQLQQTMTQAYGDLDTEQLVKLMAAAMALAELKGMDNARV